MTAGSGRKRLKAIGSFTILMSLSMLLTVTISCTREPVVNTWSYDQFMEAVEQKQVTAVIISADYSQATAKVQDGQQFLVQLPSNSDLLNTLTKQGIEISVRSPMGQEAPIRDFPALVMIGIYLVVSLLFWLWVLIDCATQSTDRQSIKIMWLIIILVTNWIGALIYLLVRQSKR